MPNPQSQYGDLCVCSKLRGAQTVVSVLCLSGESLSSQLSVAIVTYPAVHHSFGSPALEPPHPFWDTRRGFRKKKGRTWKLSSLSLENLLCFYSRLKSRMHIHSQAMIAHNVIVGNSSEVNTGNRCTGKALVLDYYLSRTLKLLMSTNSNSLSGLQVALLLAPSLVEVTVLFWTQRQLSKFRRWICQEILGQKKENDCASEVFLESNFTGSLTRLHTNTRRDRQTHKHDKVEEQFLPSDFISILWHEHIW